VAVVERRKLNMGLLLRIPLCIVGVIRNPNCLYLGQFQ
jgi:hypothetical protein